MDKSSGCYKLPTWLIKEVRKRNFNLFDWIIKKGKIKVISKGPDFNDGKPIRR